MGVDWGTATPGAAVVLRFLPNETWHVVEEIHVADKLPSWWKDKIAELWSKWKVDVVWCDPEDPGRAGELREEGIPARKANNEVHRGIRSVASAIKQKRFLVDRSCPTTAAQIASYHWAEDSKGVRREQPAKENDHAVDAVRYAIHSESAPQAEVERRGYGSA